MGRRDPGQPFPTLVLSDLDGHGHRLDEAWAAGPALIAIGHSECATTRLALPYVARLHAARGAGAGVTAVLQDSPEDARRLAVELGLALPVLLDPDPYRLSEALELELVPTFLLVTPDGRIERASEAFRRDELEAFAARLGVPAPFFLPGDAAPALRPG